MLPSLQQILRPRSLFIQKRVLAASSQQSVSCLRADLNGVQACGDSKAETCLRRRRRRRRVKVFGFILHSAGCPVPLDGCRAEGYLSRYVLATFHANVSVNIWQEHRHETTESRTQRLKDYLTLLEPWKQLEKRDGEKK